MADEKKPVNGTEDDVAKDATPPETGQSPDAEPAPSGLESQRKDASSEADESEADTPETAEAPESSEAPDGQPEQDAAETPSETADEPGTSDEPELSPWETAAGKKDPEAEAADAETPDEAQQDAGDKADEPPAPAPLPVVQEKIVERKGGFFPMLLGGVVAAALGYGASAYQTGSFPFGSGEQDGFEADTTATLQDHSARLDTLGSEVQAAAEATAGIDLSGLETSVSDLGARLDAASGEFGALSARLDEFAARIDTLEKRPVEETVSPEAIAAYERELDEVRQAIATQRAEVEQMTRDALAAEANAEEQAALSQARAALSEVTSALTQGDSFLEALVPIEAAGVAVPEAMSSVAADGVATLLQLTEDYAPAAREALAAARRAETEGQSGADRVTTFFANQLGARSVTPRDGDGADAILSRAEAALREGDLALTLTELDALPEVAEAPLSDWIARAQARRDAVAAAQAVAQELNKE